MRNIITYIILAASIIWGSASLAKKADTKAFSIDPYHIDSIKIYKATEAVTVNFIFNPQDYSLGRNNKIIVTPALVNGFDTIRFNPLTVAGKHGWYYEIRNSHTPLTSLYRAGKGQPVGYSSTIDYQPWMEHCTFTLISDTISCCGGEGLRRGSTSIFEPIWGPPRFTETFNYIAPLDTMEKRFELSGRANVRFIVNKTDIDWSYANNYVELDSILRTVRVVRNNPDAAVDSIILTGYASPEGPYANNVRLADGRTEVVKEYVRNNADFPSSVYHTASVPEDWQGLRAWLVTSNLDNRDEMVAFIDNYDGPIAAKNDRFAQQFPKEYPWLLTNVYPPLRHTDYRITYTVRRYYTVEDIKRVFDTYPRNLSLNELFILANSYPKGSAEFDNVMNTAVLLFPDNIIANLNAANSAMNIGDYARAERMLYRLEPTPDVLYARGVLAGCQGDYDKARQLFEEAREAGFKDVEEALKLVDEAENRLEEGQIQPINVEEFEEVEDTDLDY